MFYPPSVGSSAAARNSSACSVLGRDDSKVCRPNSHRAHETVCGLGKSHFLDRVLELKVPSAGGRALYCSEFHSRRYDRHGKGAVLVRALEGRQSSLEKWSEEDRPPSSSRWQKVKQKFSLKKQWKPSNEGQEDPSKASAVAGAIEAERPQLTPERLLEDVKKTAIFVKGEAMGAAVFVKDEAVEKAIIVKDYLMSLDKEKVQNLVTTTRDRLQEVPLPPYAGKLVTALATILLFGIVLDALTWRLGKMAAAVRHLNAKTLESESASYRARAPSALSVLLDKDLRKKESVEWVNMVLGKLWNLYRIPLEIYCTELLQPIIDDLEKPDYVSKVGVKSFFLGDDPLTIRTVERRTSRRADDLQYHIGVRYTGGARVMLGVTLKWWIIAFTLPVGVRGLDIDAEAWVKLRMLPVDPFVGQASWAFVTLPKIKLVLAPFGLLNLMSIPLVSIFLAKLLTEDLPKTFVLPKKNVIDLLQGRTIDTASGTFLIDKSKTFSGELSVTLVEGSKVSYIPYLKTDPYVIFGLGEQVRRSKRNSQTSVIGAPGAPVWNQDFKLLVVDNKVQHLSLTLHDTLGFTSYPVGSGDIDLRTLQDTVPVDRKVTLKTGWGPLPKRFAGELILRLTFKAYIDEDEEEVLGGELTKTVEEIPGAVEQVQEVAKFFQEEGSKFFEEKDRAKEMFSSLSTITSAKDVEGALPLLGMDPEALKKVNGKDPSVDSNGSAKTSKGSPKTLNGTPKMTATKNGSANAMGRVAASTGGNGTMSSTKEPLLVPVKDNALIVSNQPRQESKNALKETSVADLLKQGELQQRALVFIWLAVAAGIAWVVAADLNFSNLFNP